MAFGAHAQLHALHLWHTWLVCVLVVGVVCLLEPRAAKLEPLEWSVLVVKQA